jgi:putative ABC transport system permease protein
MNELRNAMRRLRARPSVALLSIAILGIGLAVTHFLFGAVNGMVLRPLPFPHAERLVSIGWHENGVVGLESIDVDDWLRLRPLLTSYDLIAVDGGISTVNLSRNDGVQRYNGAMIDSNVLPLLGEQPLLGRGFSAEDDRPGAPLTVLIGERVWRNDFHADPAVIGTTLKANGEQATIIGVMAESFGYPRGQQVWLPRRLAAGDGFAVNVMARLAEGVSIEQARLALESTAQQLGAELAESLEGDVLSMRPLAHNFVNDVTRRMAWMMFCASLLVLVLACANVANLQLTNVMTRRRELAIRSALGAGRGRLLRELLAESLVITTAASLVAIVLAHYGGLWVLQGMIANENLPAYYIRFDYDWRDGVFIVTVAAASCLMAGLAPAARAARMDINVDLQEGSKGTQGGLFARVSNGLVVAEIALTVVLLVGAAMFLRGIEGMMRADLGTDSDPATILTGRVGIFPNQFPTPESQVRFFQRTAEALRAEPGVLAATAGTGLPGSTFGSGVDVRAEGQPADPAGSVPTDAAAVDEGFADVYAPRLLAGRHIDARDRADTLPVAVIDVALARRLWPDRDPLGQRFHGGSAADAPLLTVVGVVDTLRLREIDSNPRPTLLRPMSQWPTRFATVAVRLRDDAMSFAPRLAEVLRSVDADTPVYWVRTQAEAVRLGRAGPVLLTQIFSGVGAVALVLAAAGLYGVLSFSVAQRTRELGIRRAIGAGTTVISRLVARRIGWQLAAGLAIGVLLALPWSVALADPALNTRGLDPAIFGSVLLLILVVAVVSGLAPLRRALRVDPMVALRHD